MPADTEENDKNATSTDDEPIEGEVIKKSAKDNPKIANPLNNTDIVNKPRSRTRVFMYVLLGFLVFIYVAGTILTTVLSHATNSWTGKGDNDDWSNVQNWSLGLPLNGQTLLFNLSKVNFKHTTFIKDAGMPGGGYSVALYDNIKNLAVKKIIFTGGSTKYDQLPGQVNPAIVGGQTVAITDILTNNTSHNNYIGFYNQVNFTKNVLTKSIQNGSGIYFYGTVNIGNQAIVHLQTAQNSEYSVIEFDGPLTGNGSLVVNADGNVYFPGSSPQFSGLTTISSGAVVHLGETTTNAKGITTHSSVDGLGNGAISILNGGNLELDATGVGDYGGAQSTQFIVPNNLNLTGSGTAYTSRSTLDTFGTLSNATGSLTGAINSCMAMGQEGCVGYQAGQGLNTVTFTGQVTLTGNAQIGVITEPMTGLPFTMYSYTDYVFKKPVINLDKYSLLPVANSQVQITD